MSNCESYVKVERKRVDDEEDIKTRKQLERNLILFFPNKLWWKSDHLEKGYCIHFLSNSVSVGVCVNENLY